MTQRPEYFCSGISHFLQIQSHRGFLWIKSETQEQSATVLLPVICNRPIFTNFRPYFALVGVGMD